MATAANQCQQFNSGNSAEHLPSCNILILDLLLPPACPLLPFTNLLISRLMYLGLRYFSVPGYSHSSAWVLPFQDTAISRAQFPKQHDCHWVGSCKQVLSSARWTSRQLTTRPLCIKVFHNSVELCYHSLPAISCNCASAATARSVQETLRGWSPACI